MDWRSFGMSLFPAARFNNGEGGGWGRLLVALTLLSGLTLGSPADAAETEWSAYQQCEQQTNAVLNTFIQSHGAQYAQGMRCTRTTLIVDQAWELKGEMLVDVYHTGNFQWSPVMTVGYGTGTLDPVKSCGGGCPYPGKGPLLAGNPIDLATGAKIQREQDLAASTAAGPEFFRTWLGDDIVRPGSQFPGRWRGSYDRRIHVLTYSNPQMLVAFRQDGTGLYFSYNGSNFYKGDTDTPLTLEKVFDGATHTGWKLTDADDRVEQYDASGRLLSITDRNNETLQLMYDGNSRLISVSGRDGRSIVFAYDGQGRLQSLTDAAGAVTTYAYDAGSGQLGTVTHPDGATRRYFYNEAGYVVSPPAGKLLLTGIEDESGQRYASFSYNASQRAITSTHAGNADRVDVTYNPGNVSLTDALGRTVTRNWQVTQRAAKFTFSSGLSAAGNQIKTVSYDGAGYQNLTTDYLGRQADHDFNARGLETQRIEASNDWTGSKRTTQTDWHATLRVPIVRSVLDAAGTLKSKTTWTYNARGQVLTHSIIDPTVVPNLVRTTTYAWCEQADVTAGTCPFVGLLLSVDGPRTDVDDHVQYAYRMVDEATCATTPVTCPYRKGDLWKVTQAPGQAVEQVAETVKSDGAGRPLQIKDANGVVTDLEYHARGWLTARKTRGVDNAVETDDQITRIEYWPTGLVKRVIQPDGAYTQYSYDAAHRLTGIADNAGNTISYTLNAVGDRTKEDTRDPNGALARTLGRTYNTLGQLQVQTDAYGRSTAYTYDANGNLDQTTDALGRKVDNSVDPLDRLASSLQDMTGVAAETKFAYDALDQLTKVTDPKGLQTLYSYTALGDLTQLNSPDTGITAYLYDSAGNRTRQTDARGKIANYAYDALNRLTTVAYPTEAALDTTYTWDVAQAGCPSGETYSKGRLAKIADGSGTTVYCHDRFGNLVRKMQTTNGKVFTLRYVYEVSGRLQKVIYPGGAEVVYTRDNQGRVSAITVTTESGAAQTLLHGVGYHPFGPAAQWIYGAPGAGGRMLVRTLNQNYQPGIVQDMDAGGLSLGYEFDEVGNLKRLRNGNQNDPPLRVYGYDGLNRLTEAKDGATNAVLQGYAYDKTGNRTSATIGGATTTYTYPAGNHRLSSVGSATRTYDGNGNTTQIPGAVQKNFVYGDHNRMTQYKEGTTVRMTYAYNGKGEQVRRYASGTTNVYSMYDEAGHWLGEYDDTGTAMQQVIWMDDLPVGLLVGASANQKLHYIESDALGTPRVVIDPTRGGQGTTIWRWDLTGEAFGNSVPNEDPDGDTIAFTFSMRFPGQRYDAASGLNYNYFRDYEPGSGRYSQSDPVGLGGGISTYGYVSNKPLMSVDPTGLIENHITGRWIDCGAGCRIRIDKTVINGVVKRHLHWECKRDDGECGENGETSHGGKWENVPERVRQCALAAGFAGAFSEESEPSERRMTDWEYWEELTGLTGAALATYLIISEGSRLFPPRNFVPVP